MMGRRLRKEKTFKNIFKFPADLQAYFLHEIKGKSIKILATKPFFLWRHPSFKVSLIVVLISDCSACSLWENV